MDTLTVAYEGMGEVKVVNKNSLNRQYEHFSSRKTNILLKFLINLFAW